MDLCYCGDVTMSALVQCGSIESFKLFIWKLLMFKLTFKPYALSPSQTLDIITIDWLVIGSGRSRTRGCFGKCDYAEHA